MNPSEPHATPDPTARGGTEQVSFAGPPIRREPRGRRAGRAAAWMAVGAIGATAITGIALAAGTDDPERPAGSSSPAAPEGGPRAGGPDGRHGGGPGLLARGQDVLHGELVVKDGDGTKTVLTQNGTITAASSTSLTVKSTDGFVATWTLNDDTTIRAFAAKGAEAKASDLEVGDEVTAAGTKSTATSGVATIVHVKPTEAELAKLRESMPERGWGKGPGQRPDPAPSTAPSAEANPSAA